MRVRRRAPSAATRSARETTPASASSCRVSWAKRLPTRLRVDIDRRLIIRRLGGDRRLPRDTTRQAGTQKPERKDQELAMATTPANGLQKVKTSMMNAVHDLPLLVARDEGFFRDEGLDVEILKTPGTAQRRADHQDLRDKVF